MYDRNAGTNPPSATSSSRPSTAEQAQERARDAANQAQQKAQQAAGQAQEKAGDALEKAQQKVEPRLEDQKHRATEQISGVADALRQSSQQLHANQQDAAAQVIERGAEQIDRVSRYIGQRSVDELVGDVERFARREPALFLGGALALGLFGARFLKSSREGNGQSSAYQDRHRTLGQATVGAPGATSTGVPRNYPPQT